MRLRGGGGGPPLVPEMAVAAGGKIRQVIHADEKCEDWRSERTTVFNVQVLKPAVYQSVTGSSPPSKPMTAEEYKRHRYPFFKVYEEPSGISGDFSLVKSVGEIDNTVDKAVEPDTVVLGQGDGRKNTPTGLANPMGPLKELRTARDLKEYDGYHVANF